jgi:hypothetical protein
LELLLALCHAEIDDNLLRKVGNSLEQGAGSGARVDGLAGTGVAPGRVVVAAVAGIAPARRRRCGTGPQLLALQQAAQHTQLALARNDGAMEHMAQQLLGLSHQLSQHQQAASDSLRKLVDGRMAQSLAEARASRQELQQHFQQLQEAMAQQLHRLQQGTLHNAEQLRTTLNERLSAIQTDNADKLEAMRRTVDEKLHATLEQRLGESFKLVSDRLEQVHKGLGEMQTLAGSVGDLKRVMTNVKTRGTWGELQLGASSTTCSPRAVRQERQDRAGQR